MRLDEQDTTPKRNETLADIETRLRLQLTDLFGQQPGLSQLMGNIAWWLQWKKTRMTEEAIEKGKNAEYVKGQRDAVQDIILQFQTWTEK